MFLTDEQAGHIVGIIGGTVPRTPLLKELQEWAKAELDLLVLGYFCDYLDGTKPRLKIVLWNLEVMDKVQEKDSPNYDKNIQHKFQEKFAALANKYNMHNDFTDAERIFVCYDTVQEQIQTKTLKDVKEQIYALEGGDIWKLHIRNSSVYVFYYTEMDIARNEQCGRSEVIRSKIRDIVRVNDTNNQFVNGVSVYFASKEKLDKEYDGSFYFYFS